MFTLMSERPMLIYISGLTINELITEQDNMQVGKSTLAP